MAWCRLEDTFHDEPKWRAAAKMLGIGWAAVAGHASILWSWALRHAPDGLLPEHVDSDELARVVGYEDGDNELLMKTLLQLQILEMTDDGISIHGYANRTESFNRAKQKRKSRSADKRLRRVSDMSQTLDRLSTTERRGEEMRRDEIINKSAVSCELVAQAGKEPASRGAVSELVDDANKRLLKDATEAVQRSWIDGYGLEFVKTELKRANMWLLANPKRAPKQFSKFFTNWLSRAYEMSRKQVPTNREALKQQQRESQSEQVLAELKRREELRAAGVKL